MGNEKTRQPHPRLRFQDGSRPACPREASVPCNPCSAMGGLGDPGGAACPRVSQFPENVATWPPVSALHEGKPADVPAPHHPLVHQALPGWATVHLRKPARGQSRQRVWPPRLTCQSGVCGHTRLFLQKPGGVL